MHYHPSIIKGEPFAGPSGRPGETIVYIPYSFGIPERHCFIRNLASAMKSSSCSSGAIWYILSVARRELASILPAIGMFGRYDSLRRRGLLIQVERKNDAGSALYYYRSANATERRALGYHD